MGAKISEETLQKLAAATLHSGTRTGKISTRTTLYAQAVTAPESLPDDLTSRILAGKRVPQSVHNAIKSRVTAEMREHIRGPKHRKLNIATTRRSLEHQDENGDIHQLRAMDVITADDAHFNQGLYYPCDDAKVPGAAKYGVRAARAQNLIFCDVATGRVLHHSIILRHSDAYNQRDIRWALRSLVSEHGIPRLHLHFEHGAWAAKELTEACNDVGVPIRHAQSAKGKSIVESRFREHQKFMRLLLPGKDLGISFGEFDFNQKQWCDIRAGRLDPRKCGYLPAEQFMQAVTTAWQMVNARVMRGDLYKWAPDAEWARHISENGEAKRPTIEQLAQLSPERRKVAVGSKVPNAVVVASAEAEAADTLLYRAKFMVALGRNYPVTVCFDPLTPERAAILSAAKPGRGLQRRALREFDPDWGSDLTPAQLDGQMREGEFVGWATLSDRVPMFSDNWETVKKITEERRGQLRHVRRMCESLRPLPLPLASAPRGAVVDESHDGRGNATRLEYTPRGAAPPPSPAPPPPPARDTLADQPRMTRVEPIPRIIAPPPASHERDAVNSYLDDG